MDEATTRKIIHEEVFPDMEEFFDATEDSLFIFMRYNDDEHVSSTLIPSPDIGIIKEVAKKLAKEIHKEMNDIPSDIIIVEKIKFTDIDLEAPHVITSSDMRDGIVVIKVGVLDSKHGMAFLYSDDMDEISFKYFDFEDDDAPPKLKLATASLVNEFMILGGVTEREEEDEEDHTNFRFSRN